MSKINTIMLAYMCNFYLSHCTDSSKGKKGKQNASIVKWSQLRSKHYKSPKQKTAEKCKTAHLWQRKLSEVSFECMRFSALRLLPFFVSIQQAPNASSKGLLHAIYPLIQIGMFWTLSLDPPLLLMNYAMFWVFGLQNMRLTSRFTHF